jgi:hypothetical protein
MGLTGGAFRNQKITGNRKKLALFFPGVLETKRTSKPDY